MRARTFNDAERQTAYHEAGHATVAWLLGAKVLELSREAGIIPDPLPRSDLEAIGQAMLRVTGAEPIRRSSGHCHHSDGLSPEDEVVVLLAGWEAQARIAPPDTRWQDHAGIDVQEALKLIATLPDPWRQAQKLPRRARRLIARYWSRVEALAKQLLYSRTMGSGQVHVILEDMGCVAWRIHRAAR